jgi:hypothetical protein
MVDAQVSNPEVAQLRLQATLAEFRLCGRRLSKSLGITFSSIPSPLPASVS